MRNSDSDNMSLITRHSVAKDALGSGTITIRRMGCLVFPTFLAWSSAGSDALGTHHAHAQLPIMPVPPIPPGSHIATSSGSHQPFTRQHALPYRLPHTRLPYCNRHNSSSCTCAPFVVSRHPSSDDPPACIITASSIASCPSLRPRDPRQDHIPSVS